MSETATVNTKGLVGVIIGDGRYDLRELLGGGSMGYVYRAFDRRLETDVVVKIPRRHKLENPDSLRRFRQESKFMVKLTHPHIVSILDVGEHDGAPFFVMPFVSGGCLRSRQKNELGLQKSLSPSSLRGWLLEIAKALDFIHKQDCIHRDVKPDNILFDDHGHAFLSDFGLSKIVRNSESEAPDQTAAGAIVGTPLFTAPELVLGNPIDGRADQYSLALTVYDTLAGTNPFLGPNSSATMVNQINVSPPPLMEWNPAVSQEVWRAVSRGLSKSPKERYESCVAFADAVLAALLLNGSSKSSATHAGVKNSGRHSSASNSLTDTSITARTEDPGSRRSPVSAKSMASSTKGRMAGEAKLQYVVAARSPIIKAKSTCPACSKIFNLQPTFAGKKASCQSCGKRLLISADFSEVQQLELVNNREQVASDKLRSSAMAGNVEETMLPGEFDLVLGQHVFGWKIGRRWALGLAVALLSLLLLMTWSFTNRSNRQEQDRLREQYRPRTMERE